jgi:glycosyltransferase involved in cell wall biosynthesis
MRAAVAHEWLTNWAGSERVAREMVDVSRAAQLVTSIADPGFVREYFPDLPVRALWPTRLPDAAQRWTRYGPAMIGAWAAARIEADLLLVSSHFAAHAATLRFAGPSIVYYHTPARMLWRSDMELARLPRPTRAAVQHVALPPLRRWDAFVARKPTVVLANSTAVAERIAQAYGRTAEVLHPPVDVDRWSSVARVRPEFHLWLGRLVAYKRPDIAVEAARISGQPLVLVGDGPERARLEQTAPPNVTFLGRASDSTLRELLSKAHSLVFPGEEDFGIAPVEAMASGVPVVAFDAGGARDFVVHGINGIMVPEQDGHRFAGSLVDAAATPWDELKVRHSAQRFDRAAFRSGLRNVIDRL